MWSLGCIVAEMYTGYPLFPGENEQEQLACIMEIFGLPPASLLEQASRSSLFFDSQGRPRHLVNSKGKTRQPGSKSLHHAMGKCQDSYFLDFIARCLDWDPLTRLTPVQALNHPWIQHVYPRTTAKRVSSRRKTITAAPPPSSAPLGPVGGMAGAPVKSGLISASAPGSGAMPAPVPALTTSAAPPQAPVWLKYSSGQQGSRQNGQQLSPPGPTSTASHSLSSGAFGQSSAASARLGSITTSNQGTVPGTNMARITTGMTSPLSPGNSGGNSGGNFTDNAGGDSSYSSVRGGKSIPPAFSASVHTSSDNQFTSSPETQQAQMDEGGTVMRLLQKFPQPA